MPVVAIAPKPAAVESYSGRTARPDRRLTEHEAEDLCYLWQGYAADLGIRSAHSMVERHILLRAPPRNVRAPVLEELVVRQHGRAPEGRIIRCVVADGLATKHEVRMAILYLTRVGRKGPRIERIPVPRPETPTTCGVKRDGRECGHPCSSCEWTGFDLRATDRGAVPMGLSLQSVPRTREDRWRAADEALEAEWHMIPCGVGSETHAPSMRDEPLGARQRRAVDRATAALSRCSRETALVLQALYGQHHVSEESELEAVRRAVGGSREGARLRRDAACAAYRLAREGR